ncbi:phage tail protein [Pelagicoccus sp. NFK12]|uniref:Phage tail protein n=1 Tax=Pelagicoccus enzymogenes TaxID=2773457 RepID=A0A927F968_9BACT|nr:phage tail protein [Pelagicoccus enzymogenes]MBD5780639.1 phage tail protein [Pelagicoccus enzymogenes]MDQ8198960.1 phage tail protein [Pelagicoccus enzymogenes]
MNRFGFLGAFHFRVEFLGLGGDSVDTRFQSVSGLSSSIETDSLREGGENRFEHALPSRTSYSDLVLKRGFVTSSALLDWFSSAMQTLEIYPKDLNVVLLNEKHEPAMTWKVTHAWPKKWAIGDLDAETSAIAIETLELGYHDFRLEK